MSTDIANLWSAIQRRDVREVAKQLTPSPAVANCDVCDERPGERMTKAAGGVETWICEQCDEEEHARMLGRRLPRFRTSDDRDAYEAGSKARGEI